MDNIATGTLVKHVSLGVGKVVAVEPTALHVFFPASDKRYAAKLRWPTARPLLTLVGVQPDAWLTGLTSFAFDAGAGRYALAANFLSHDEALAEFLERYPGGFEGPAYLGLGKRSERAARWRAAGVAWVEGLGEGKGERLLADGEIAELARRAIRAGAEVTGAAGAVEQDALVEALEPGDEVAAYFDALLGLLAPRSPSQPRFEKLLAASGALGVAPDLAWPMLTLFPSIADPTRYLLLAPRSACAAAVRLGCDLRFKPAPGWTTYNAWRGLAEGLLESQLKAHGARDLVDAEVFLHAVATPPARKRPSSEAVAVKGETASSKVRKAAPRPAARAAPR